MSTHHQVKVLILTLMPELILFAQNAVLLCSPCQLQRVLPGLPLTVFPVDSLLHAKGQP